MKILIFAPHPDDEILSCAGLIYHLHQEKNEVFIVYATNGDFKGKGSSFIRYEESRAALYKIGISEKQMIFMGFGDTGMELDDSFLWRLWINEENMQFSSFVSAETYHPYNLAEYSMQVWGKHLLYSKGAFIKILDHLLISLKPDEIYCSSLYDSHGDHKALYFFVRNAAMRCKLQPEFYYYIIHGGNDRAWPERKSSFFSCPINIPKKVWNNRFMISVPDQLMKRGLINIFKSQISGSGYLISFAKKEEFFLKENMNEEIIKNSMAKI